LTWETAKPYHDELKLPTEKRVAQDEKNIPAEPP
jgi:hypothetical protein